MQRTEKQFQMQRKELKGRQPPRHVGRRAIKGGLSRFSSLYSIYDKIAHTERVYEKYMSELTSMPPTRTPMTPTQCLKHSHRQWKPSDGLINRKYCTKLFAEVMMIWPQQASHKIAKEL